MIKVKFFSVKSLEQMRFLGCADLRAALFIISLKFVPKISEQRDGLDTGIF